LIYYHVPEDSDRPENPNVFLLPVAANKLQLHHIYQHFPLRGTYTFRFKVAFNDLIVWLDLNDPHSPVPTFKEQIYLKASRLSWEGFKKPQPTTSDNRSLGKNIPKKESIDIFEHHHQVPSHKKSTTQTNFGNMSLLDGNSPGSSSGLHPAISEPSFKVDFFGDEK